MKPIVPEIEIKKKPRPVVKKAKKAPTPTKLNKKKPSHEKQVQAASPPAEHKPKVKPVPPVAPKPTLSISSDLNKSNKWQAKKSTRNLDAKKLSIRPLNKPAQHKAVLTPLPEEDTSAKQIQQSSKPSNNSTKIKDLDVGEIGKTNMKSDIQTGVGQLKEFAEYKVVNNHKKSGSAASGSGSESTDTKSGSEFEGEIRQRKVIYKPEPPDLDIDSDVTITLRFTVLPNGQVDQIFPIRKADATLERLAIGLLQQYRFEPLFENDSIQNGTIHFTIQRNRRDK